MTMPRLTYVAGVALLARAGAFLLTDALLGPRPGVSRWNARRIQPGMTVKEVEARFGGPGATGLPISWIPSGLPSGAHLSQAVWHGPPLTVRVWFDRSGRLRLIERGPRAGPAD